ncbi:hypothetical protein FY134_03045 [Agrobacterium fabrum]|uniref:hypothetical protein n=1 Tax=Agrobacterium fabrum TaxID=1176649 RepID=UPI0021CE2515|nr:hypothetical protein [Agrobacterium fabrum]UXT56675.1 hypothetical protein FY134_03045 [Agrobacterium fabrum]
MTMFIDESDLCPALETLNEFGVHWSLIRLFYKISHDYRKGDDGIERRYASLSRDNRYKSHMYLPDEVEHVIECKGTGLRFWVSNYSGLNWIEFGAVDHSWRLMLSTHVREYDEESTIAHLFGDRDGSIVVAQLVVMEGHGSEYGRYPAVLKHILAPRHEHSGFDIVREFSKGSEEPMNREQLSAYNSEKMAQWIDVA